MSFAMMMSGCSRAGGTKRRPSSGAQQQQIRAANKYRLNIEV
jgi:hypothetical protein